VDDQTGGGRWDGVRSVTALPLLKGSEYIVHRQNEINPTKHGIGLWPASDSGLKKAPEKSSKRTHLKKL
jgi:hypothetical protein